MRKNTTYSLTSWFCTPLEKPKGPGLEQDAKNASNMQENMPDTCQGHSSLDTPSELNPPQRIPSPLFVALLVPQAKG